MRNSACTSSSMPEWPWCKFNAIMGLMSYNGHHPVCVNMVQSSPYKTRLHWPRLARLGGILMWNGGVSYGVTVEKIVQRLLVVKNTIVIVGAEWLNENTEFWCGQGTQQILKINKPRLVLSIVLTRRCEEFFPSSSRRQNVNRSNTQTDSILASWRALN